MSNLRFLTAGESHGPGLTIVVEGMPAGVPLTEDQIAVDLRRRQGGYGRGGRMLDRTESRRPPPRRTLLSGIGRCDIA